MLNNGNHKTYLKLCYGCRMQNGPKQNVMCTCNRVRCLVFCLYIKYMSLLKYPTLIITIIPSNCVQNYPKPTHKESRKATTRLDLLRLELVVTDHYIILCILQVST
jgi:hypothetical protein